MRPAARSAWREVVDQSHTTAAAAAIATAPWSAYASATVPPRSRTDENTDESFEYGTPPVSSNARAITVESMNARQGARPNARVATALSASAEAAAAAIARHCRATRSARGTSKARCGLMEASPRSRPAATGRVGRRTRPKPKDAAIRRPLCPCSVATKTAGKIAATASARNPGTTRDVAARYAARPTPFQAMSAARDGSRPTGQYGTNAIGGYSQT